jgi:hypothetical protein
MGVDGGCTLVAASTKIIIRTAIQSPKKTINLTRSDAEHTSRAPHAAVSVAEVRPHI